MKEHMHSAEDHGPKDSCWECQPPAPSYVSDAERAAITERARQGTEMTPTDLDAYNATIAALLEGIEDMPNPRNESAEFIDRYNSVRALAARVKGKA